MKVRTQQLKEARRFFPSYANFGKKSMLCLDFEKNMKKVSNSVQQTNNIANYLITKEK